jgi:hypothetical protein
VPGEVAVTVFPMKKVKKESRVEHEAVVITEWQSEGETKWLLLKRPEKGMSAVQPARIADSRTPRRPLRAANHPGSCYGGG